MAGKPKQTAKPKQAEKPDQSAGAKGTEKAAQSDAGQQPQATGGNSAQPSLSVLVQYIKDLSFESPGAPRSLTAREKAPAININVNVNANPLGGTDYDVHLTLNARAEVDKTVLFNVELVYGGVFRMQGFSQEHMLPVLFIECPRLLFPFARQVIADATRSGGFPPLLIDPIDFARMFQQRLAEEEAKRKVQVT